MVKRILSMVMAIMMLVTVLAGCTNEEKEYLGIAKEISNLEVMQSSTIVEINADELFTYLDKAYDSSMTADDLKYYNIAKNLISQKNLELNFTINKKNFEIYMDLFLVDKASGAKEGVTTLICKNNKVYLNSYSLIAFLDKYGFVKEAELVNENAKNVKYISFNLIDLDNKSAVAEFNEGYKKGQQLVKAELRFIDELVNKAMADFSTDKVKKSGNKYTISVTGTDMANVALNLFEHYVNNAQKYGDAINSFLDSLTDEEYASFGINDMSKADFVKMAKYQINTGINNMLNNYKENELSSIKTYREELKETQIKTILDNIKLTDSIEKNGSNEYNEVVNFNMDLTSAINSTYTDKADMIDSCKIGFKITQSVKKLESADIKEPVEGVVDYKEFKKCAKQTLKVNVDYGDYIHSIAGVPEIPKAEEFTKLDIKIINDSSYLPLRKIVELFGDNVEWDVTSRKAFVNLDGSKVYLEGILINDKTYIKVRELEKVGYKVNWNETTREVEIIK